MAILENIDAPVWGISTVGYGVIAQGLASIRQCIDIILRTRKRTDPLRPTFGSNIWEYIDLPMDRAIPNIKLAIIEAIENWEKRIKIISIRHHIRSISNPAFEITYKLVDEDLIDTITFTLDRDGVVGATEVELILQAFFPANPNNYRYQIHFEKNNTGALPAPVAVGFTTVQELFSWVQANWFFYGRWFLLSDRIVLYMPSQGVTTASLSLSLLSVFQFEAVFPELGNSEAYQVSFIVNGHNALPEMPQTFNTPAAVLMWAKANWGNYATWSIQYVTGSGDTVFTDEFGDEFDNAAIFQYKLIGWSSADGFTADLTISTT